MAVANASRHFITLALKPVMDRGSWLVFDCCWLVSLPARRGAAWAEVVPWLYDGEGGRGIPKRRRPATWRSHRVGRGARPSDRIPRSPVQSRPWTPPSAIRTDSTYGMASRGTTSNPQRMAPQTSKRTWRFRLSEARCSTFSAAAGYPFGVPTARSHWSGLYCSAMRRGRSFPPPRPTLRPGSWSRPWRRKARRRGIVLTFPLMDLEDRGLRTTDLWGAVLDGHRAGIEPFPC